MQLILSSPPGGASRAEGRIPRRNPDQIHSSNRPQSLTNALYDKLYKDLVKCLSVIQNVQDTSIVELFVLSILCSVSLLISKAFNYFFDKIGDYITIISITVLFILILKFSSEKYVYKSRVNVILAIIVFIISFSFFKGFQPNISLNLIFHLCLLRPLAFVLIFDCKAIVGRYQNEEKKRFRKKLCIQSHNGVRLIRYAHERKFYRLNVYE